MRPETTKLLEENLSGKLLDIGLGDDFLDLTLKAKATKAKINKWNCINPNTSAWQGNNKMKRQPKE